VIVVKANKVKGVKRIRDPCNLDRKSLKTGDLQWKWQHWNGNNLACSNKSSGVSSL